MGLHQFCSTILLIASVILSLPSYNIRNLHATFDNNTGAIFIQWNYMRPISDVDFTVRYRLGRENSTWKYARTSQAQLLINLPEFKHGEELFVQTSENEINFYCTKNPMKRPQVKAERNGEIVDDWGQELIVTLNKKVSIGGVLIDDDELVPPLDFTTHILGPSSVKLEWRPHEGVPPELFYIVNVKQLTSESGTVFQRQQIKTSANSFTLGNLIAGERYEMTIRSALNDTKVSSTAAIVEISMPKENDYFEIGNLIISSHFHSNLRGVVNLTWEVPVNMEQKIVAFDVQYAEAENDNWQKVNFHGRKPSALLHDLKSDTEYILRIKTRLTNNIEIESGEFRFKTPKVEPNPIQKVDVIYSHDVNSVRLQWILEPHVKADLVAGYDVYVSDNKDLPDFQWKLVRLDNREAALALNNLRNSTEYFVRVDVRNKDGSVIRAPSVYRFKTIGKRASRFSHQ